ncbi:MAG: hypothetical protein H7237_04010, partial [Alkalinema sp. FL-bin-369]|nr:hypothetical protein [Leptolyngbyaceae cyanobacterium LF-bin-369]
YLKERLFGFESDKSRRFAHLRKPAFLLENLRRFAQSPDSQKEQRCIPIYEIEAPDSYWNRCVCSSDRVGLNISRHPLCKPLFHELSA